MLSRRSIFALSVVVALAAYAALFALAPIVVVFEPKSAAGAVLEYFEIQLQPGAMVEMPTPAQEEGSGLTSRPGAVSDLLARVDDLLQPGEVLEEEPAAVPALTDRVAGDSVVRDYDLTPDPLALERVDAKILEITQEAARGHIEVARRLVRPSPRRLLTKGEFPVLRSTLGSNGEEGPLQFDGTARSLLAEDAAIGEAAAAAVPEKPPYEEAVVRPESTEDTPPPELAVERLIARAPVVRATEAARRESPYALMDELVRIQLDAFVPRDEQEGYFRLRILPKEGQDLEVLPKDVTFVIDASTSIQQRKLDLTVRGLRDAIAQLRIEDRFNLVVFRDTPTPFRPEPVFAVDANKRAAHRFLDELESRGETDVYQAMLPVVREVPREGVPGVVLVVSDGRSTTGIRDGRTIINALTADNGLRHSIYAFGGGRTVNQNLLDLLAYRNKGSAYVTPDLDSIDENLPRFFRQFDAPLLTGLEADYGRINEATVFPQILPDFYRQQPVTVYGRFDPQADNTFVMRLTGTAQDKQKEVIFRADLRQAMGGDFDIARTWAFQKAYYLIGEMSRLGETPELRAELRALCQKYNIRTSYDE